jgi:uncharacterized protein YcnI
MKRLTKTILCAAGVALVAAASASAHATISPPVALSKHDQLFTLVVQQEKQSPIVKVEADLPSGFDVDTFLDAPGWKRTQAKDRVTWTGSADADVAFSFIGGSDSTGTRSVAITQTYADGSVVAWTGAEGSETPAATVRFESSLGGGGSPTLEIVALVVAVVALVVAGAGLLTRTGRPLA